MNNNIYAEINTQKVANNCVAVDTISMQYARHTAIAMYHWELGNVDTMYLEKCKVITTCYNCHQFYIASIRRL